MNLYEDIRVGETLELRIGAITAKTKVERIDSRTTFVVAQPTHKLLPLIFEENEEVQFSFFRENGIHSFRAIYAGRGTIDNFRVCGFEAISEIDKNQRRRSYRLPVMLDITVRYKREGDPAGIITAHATTVNISQEGLLFRMEEPLIVGGKVIVEIKLPGSDLCILNGAVVRFVQETEDKEKYLVAAKFMTLTKRDQTQLARFILNRQIQDRRKQQGIDLK